jgi:hypothetical protein
LASSAFRRESAFSLARIISRAVSPDSFKPSAGALAALDARDAREIIAEKLAQLARRNEEIDAARREKLQ